MEIEKHDDIPLIAERDIENNFTEQVDEFIEEGLFDEAMSNDEKIGRLKGMAIAKEGLLALIKIRKDL